MFAISRSGRLPIALLASALFTLTQVPSDGLAADLDELSEQQLDAALDAELGEDDLQQCGDDDLDAPTTKEDMLEFILCALGNEGDDQTEQGITWEELEAEMQEVGTTIQEVVSQALEAMLAARHRRLDLALAGVAASTDAPSPARSTEQRLARLNFIKPGKAALPLVKVALRSAIRSR